MLSSYEAQRQWQARAVALKAEAVTPAHSAAEAALEADEARHGDAERRRDRVQHEADGYLHEEDLPEVAHADVPKAFRQAFDVPSGYPEPRQMHAEEFRRPPAAGHADYGPGYGPPARPVPVPSGTLQASMITRPLLTEGQSRACPPGPADVR